MFYSVPTYVCWRISIYFVLTNAPCLLCLLGGSKLFLCSLVHLVCLSEGSQFVLCSLMHLVCLGGPRSVSVLDNAPRLLCLPGGSQPFLCSLMHHVCWIGPNLFLVLANAPRLSVCLQGPIWYVLTNAPHLSGGGPKSVSCANAPCLLCLPGGSQPFFLCSLMHHVCQCLLGGFQVF